LNHRDKDLKTMADEELEEFLDECSLKRIEIDSQLTEAKEKLFQNIEVDPVWYGQAKKAKNINAWLEGKIQREISHRKKEAKRTAHEELERSREHRFIEIVRDRIDPEIYREAWRMVNDENPNL
jgi:hypothetical protein